MHSLIRMSYTATLLARNLASLGTHFKQLNTASVLHSLSPQSNECYAMLGL
jgi:hypothetical protein